MDDVILEGKKIKAVVCHQNSTETEAIIISGLKLLFGFPIPIIIALMLNEIRMKFYKKTIQTIIYFPHFLSWVVIGSIWFVILAPLDSINAQLAELIGMEPVYWFASKEHIRSLLVITDIWACLLYTSAEVYIAYSQFMSDCFQIQLWLVDVFYRIFKREFYNGAYDLGLLLGSQFEAGFQTCAHHLPKRCAGITGG